MYYCTRPHCPSPENRFPDSPDSHTKSGIFCQACGMPLILKGRKGHYQTIKPLGKGGFGATFQGIDLDSVNQRQCVIKRLNINDNPEIGDKIVEGIKAAFDREAQVLEFLGDNSGNIPTLYDYFSFTAPAFGQQEELEFKYLVQQYIQGEDISKELKRKGRFSETETLDFLKQILPILQFIHDQNSIHRDIKPSNIVRETATQKLFLIDFGAVKQVFSGQINVQSAIVFHTKVYAAPEQRPEEGIIGQIYPSSDLYSLAVTCLELLTGTTPVDYLSNNYQNWRQQASRIISPSLANILDKMLKVNPRHRFQSAAEVMKAINESRISKPLTEPPTEPPTIIPKQLETLKPLLIKSVFLILPIIVGVIGVNSYLRSPKVVEVVEYAKSGIKFQYPKDWEETPAIDQLTRIVPKNTISSSLTPEFFITTEELFSSETLEDYTKFSIQRIEESGQNTKIIKSEPIQLGETQGYQVVYESRDNIHKVNFQEMQVWIVNGQKAYILTYRAEDKSYPEFVKTVEDTIIKSFKLETNKLW
ncbi:protein kinase [Sphaerospermopsis kisseleviana CS-549]|uniref:non-specific serine/threonine protein kinase n=1 Tax=Sphaerospermopsis kisseleviana CS-549 TaxID=3021783 RepID=A0ABT4ZQI7_9CYAN|nr:serine/threonine-protein kinase [Sphaerospermopsis kisseleviana]MDB9441431.1 protein kinase [Sphaerospermopsis kisseleviana CS-549]BAZ80023.1 serine/threonine protein kinase [Sphaerospermopsis kisseleviana NIES-73]